MATMQQVPISHLQMIFHVGFEGLERMNRVQPTQIVLVVAPQYMRMHLNITSKTWVLQCQVAIASLEL